MFRTLSVEAVPFYKKPLKGGGEPPNLPGFTLFDFTLFLLYGPKSDS